MSFFILLSLLFLCFVLVFISILLVFTFSLFLVCFGLHFLQFLSYIFSFIYIHSPLCYFWVRFFQGLQLFWGNWKLTTFKMLEEYDVSKHYKIQSFCRMKMFITSLCSCNVLKRGYLHTYELYFLQK